MADFGGTLLRLPANCTDASFPVNRCRFRRLGLLKAWDIAWIPAGQNALRGGLAGSRRLRPRIGRSCEPHPTKMKVKLIELNPLGHKRKVVVETLPAVLGRCNSSQILVEDQWVSRRHCELNELNGILVVRDLGSKHGTYIN